MVIEADDDDRPETSDFNQYRISEEDFKPNELSEYIFSKSIEQNSAA